MILNSAEGNVYNRSGEEGRGDLNAGLKWLVFTDFLLAGNLPIIYYKTGRRKDEARYRTLRPSMRLKMRFSAMPSDL